MEALALPFLLLVGSLLALQAAANVQLSTAMTSPFGASALQLGIGAALLVALAVVAGTWLIVRAQTATSERVRATSTGGLVAQTATGQRVTATATCGRVAQT